VRPHSTTRWPHSTAVASAGASWNDIATVLLVGGSSQIPLVAQVVREHTGRPVATATNPHLAIALGAFAACAGGRRRGRGFQQPCDGGPSGRVGVGGGSEHARTVAVAHARQGSWWPSRR
jgi:hypothetical protein